MSYIEDVDAPRDFGGQRAYAYHITRDADPDKDAHHCLVIDCYDPKAGRTALRLMNVPCNGYIERQEEGRTKRYRIDRGRLVEDTIGTRGGIL